MDDLLAHRQWVRSLARRLAADESSADDLEQETWLAAVEHPPRDARSVRGWLGTVVRNLHRNRVRGTSRRERRELEHLTRESEPGAPELVAEAETQHALVREVLDLDEPYRGAVLLRWYEDLTPTQIAARTGVSVDTVKTRLRRAVERLRERMDARHGGDRRAWLLLALGHGDGEGIGVGPGSGTAAALAAGGVAMGAAMKIGIAAGVLFAVGAWVWWAKTDGTAPPVAPVETAAAMPKSAPRHEPRDTASDPSSAPDSTAAASSSGADPAHPDRDLDLHGVVVRADATPVAGAKVETVDYPWRRTMTMDIAAMFAGVSGPATTSNAAGEFALRLRRGEARIVRVSAEGLGTREIGPYQAGERVKLVMTAAVTLHITVQDEAGAPVAGAALWLLGFGNRGDQPWVNARGATDAAGKCDFAGLPGGAQVMVLPQAGVGDWGAQRVPLPAEGESSLALVSPAGRTLRGRVFDAVTLAPIDGAKVGLGKGVICATTADGGGRFELRGFTGKSERNLGVVAPGYAATAIVVPSGEGPIEIALQRGFVATGRIVGVDGTALPGVHVTVGASQRGAGVELTSSGHTMSAEDGRFRIADLNRALPHVLSVFIDGSGRLRQMVAPPRGEAEAVDLGDVRLPAPRAIEGVVVNPDGSPSPGVDVTASGPILPQALGMPDVGARETRRSDDLGRFRFGDLSPGDYTVEARVQGATPMTTRVTLPPDRDVTDVVLPPKPTGAEIVVRVVDESGAPVPGMNVIGSGALRGAVVAISDLKGVGVLPAPAEGRITSIAVGAQDSTMAWLRNAPIQVEAGRLEYVVRMERGVRVNCRLLDPDGNPVQRAAVLVEPGDRAQYSTLSDAEGRITVTIPRQGEFSVVFPGSVYVGDKGLPTDSQFESRADGVTASSGDVVLRCRRVESGRAATVRVLAADGSPVAGIEVRIGTMSGLERKAPTDAEGRARFDDLPAREFNASVPYNPSSLAVQWIKFMPSGQEVVLQYPAATSISGAVVWPGGDAAWGASVTVLADKTFVFTTNADRDGRFTVKLPVGETRTLSLEVAGMKDRVQIRTSKAITLDDRDVRIELKP